MHLTLNIKIGHAPDKSMEEVRNAAEKAKEKFIKENINLFYEEQSKLKRDGEPQPYDNGLFTIFTTKLKVRNNQADAVLEKFDLELLMKTEFLN